ncbi:hypothetical protein SAMN05421664_3283 [Chryseobacterium soldanellicola]|uniref:Microcystin-dependent protein n=1 Tax=Chryseobacterium soldanellicola TaxID=311333 RepID=A0A1H1FWB8_9FLAO|nr:hypothetical protein [Chryseobacterium soldanellicola]SDR04826.1 hypothetical protein SAMN05421664_3283 [Chryseobacterium soldanellicola]
MKKLYATALLLVGSLVFSQVGINSIDPKATLDIVAKNTTGTLTDTDGILIPHVDRQRAQNMATVATSTMIYVNDISTGTNSGKAIHIDEAGFYYFDGSVWQKLSFNNQSYSLGDIQYSARTGDHEGWYLLDGRSIASLPANAQSAAASLGLAGNLFDATDKTLKAKSTAESIGTVGGNDSFTIAQSNLPDISLPGSANITINSAGSHTHGPDKGSGFLITGLPGGGYGGGSPGSWGGTGVASTTASAGAHTHTLSQAVTVALGGSNQPIDNRSAYLALNTFIYLGE